MGKGRGQQKFRNQHQKDGWQVTWPARRSSRGTAVKPSDTWGLEGTESLCRQGWWWGQNQGDWLRVLPSPSSPSLSMAAPFFWLFKQKTCIIFHTSTLHAVHQQMLLAPVWTSFQVWPLPPPPPPAWIKPSSSHQDPSSSFPLIFYCINQDFPPPSCHRTFPSHKWPPRHQVHCPF